MRRQNGKKCTVENFGTIYVDLKPKNNCTLFSSFFKKISPFSRYGRLKLIFLCERYSHCIHSSCSIELTKTRNTWSLTAVHEIYLKWSLQIEFTGVIGRQFNICDNKFLDRIFKVLNLNFIHVSKINIFEHFIRLFMDLLNSSLTLIVTAMLAGTTHSSCIVLTYNHFPQMSNVPVLKPRRTLRINPLLDITF